MSFLNHQLASRKIKMTWQGSTLRVLRPNPGRWRMKRVSGGDDGR
jgi:hypothetical protein